jgi:uncharacterized protein (UPF0212 family)
MGYPVSFEGTGDSLIDAILGAIEDAGRSFHDVELWDDTHCGPSCVEQIQSVANVAAQEIVKLRARITELERDQAEKLAKTTMGCNTKSSIRRR